MEELRLKISYPNNVIYKKILLRKFFYMVFISDSGKKLDVYIATVFGGITQDVKDSDIYESVQHDPQTPCSLQFEFAAPENDGKLIEEVKVTDLTDSFCGQSEWINKVWGTCEWHADQKSVAELLKKTYPGLYPEGKGEAIVEVRNSPGIYYVYTENKKSHTCIADKGGCKKLSESDQHKHGYILYNQNNGQRIDGVEIINWIQTEITLSANLLEEPVLFSIEFDQDKIYTPDFTWYFAPPTGYIVSEKSSVRIGKEKVKDAINAIQGVWDETTVLFNEWDKPPLSIKERKKSRVLLKTAPVKNIDNLSEDGRLAVALHITSPQVPSNRQFWIGLIIAFFLAFCSDKTRINDYYACLQADCSCKPDACVCRYVCNALSIFSPALLLCAFFTFVMKPQKCFSDYVGGKRFFRICRIVGLGFTVALMIYIFGLWFVVSAKWLKEYITCQRNFWILGGLFFIALASNVAYLIYCLGKLKRKIFNCL